MRCAEFRAPIMPSITTRTVLTDRCISNRPWATLSHDLERPSGRCDETGSAASYTSTYRSHEMTGFSAPTRSDPHGVDLS